MVFLASLSDGNWNVESTLFFFSATNKASWIFNSDLTGVHIPQNHQKMFAGFNFDVTVIRKCYGTDEEEISLLQSNGGRVVTVSKFVAL